MAKTPTIARGTTPTITYSFKKVNVANIVQAYLVIKQFEKACVQKDLASATIEGDTLKFRLTQEDTLSLKAAPRAFVVCDWLLADGTRGQTVPFMCDITPEGMDTVI